MSRPRAFPGAALLVLLAACGSGETSGPGTQPLPPPPPPPAPAPNPIFTSPIVGVPMQDVFYGAYLDHGSQDYECGFKWYAGHGGVDILLRNFTAQDSGVTVIAAAPGTVFLMRDGLFDRSTANNSDGFGNYVAIEHGANGPISYYGHMRNGSIRVAQNDVVKRGDTLGLVGSSGNSNWPHLHFEVRENGQVQPVDPFLGGCNRPVSQPTWISQLPWQGEFVVIDAGITDRQQSYGELLGRPPDVDTVSLAHAQVVFWTNLHNIQARSTRTLIEGPDGAVLGVVMTGAVTTFSSRFLVATIPVAGFLVAPGSYSIALLVTPNTGDGAEREVARRTFTLGPAAEPAPEAAAGRVPAILPAVSLGPDAGDQPLAPEPE